MMVLAVIKGETYGMSSSNRMSAIKRSRVPISRTSKIVRIKLKPEIFLKMDFRECLKRLGGGDIYSIDMNEIKDKILLKPQLGDHLQFELHNYCRNEIKINTNVSRVIELANLCYSNSSVSEFDNMDRFVGCVYHINSYLLKNSEYKAALNVVHVLTSKNKEIVDSCSKSSVIKNFLLSLHSIFIMAAITVASKVKSVYEENYVISHRLAIASLQVFQLLDFVPEQVTKKVLKTSKIYLHSLKHYNDSDIQQFYETLIKRKLILESDDNYLFYFICKLDFKGLDFTEGFKISEKFNLTIKILSVLGKMPLNVKTSFEKLVEFFFNSSQQKLQWDDTLFEDLQKAKEMSSYSQKEDSTKFLQNPELNSECLKSDPRDKLHFILISYIFYNGIQYWCKTFEESWSEKIDALLLQELFNKILSFYKYNCSTENLCCFPSDSSNETCFSDVLTGNLIKILHTIRMCFKNKLMDSLALSEISHKAFKLSMECIEIMKGKKCCNTNANLTWKYSVIHLTNTVEDLLRLPPSDEVWPHLRKCAEEVLSGIVNNNNFELPYEFKRVALLFQRWNLANLKSGKFFESCYVAILYYICYPEEETEVMSMWLQAKKESGNEIFQEYLMIDAIKSCTKAIQTFKKDFDLSKLDLKAVLMLELKTYGLCPNDTFIKPTAPYELICRLWKLIQKHSPDTWEIAAALSFLVITAVNTEDKKLYKEMEEKCKKAICQLKQYKIKKNNIRKDQCRSLMYVANLTFFLFLYNAKLAEKSEGNMESNEMVLGYLKKEEEERVKFGEEGDLNITCNVIPSSSHLTVDLETNYLNKLNEIVDLWNAALKSDLEDEPSKFEYELWLQNVKQVACFYELYGEPFKAATTWLLFYRIGKMCNDSAATLLGLSHLLKKSSDIEKFGMMEEAKFLSEKVDSENKEKNVLIIYWIAIASNYLKNKKPEKCLEFLTKAKTALEDLRVTIKSYILKAKFSCLVSQFLCIYPQHEEELGFPPNTDFRVMVFNAFRYAAVGGRNECLGLASHGEVTEVVLTMLEVNMWAYYFFGIYSKTDFMRFFLNDLYQIVQKLFLPSRIAEVLVRLAEVDIICEKTKECNEKINTLKSILTTLPPKSEEKSNIKLEPENIFVERLSPRAISPVRFVDDRNTREADVSPIHLHLHNTKSRARHSKNCKCRVCNNILIQLLTLTVHVLEGEVYSMEEKVLPSKSCFSKGYEAMHKLWEVHQKQQAALKCEIEAEFSNLGSLELQSKTIFFHAVKFWIKYGFHEVSKPMPNLIDLGKCLSEVNRFMSQLSFEKKLLVWNFTELKLATCLVKKELESKTPEKKKDVVDNCKTPAFSKTPMDCSKLKSSEFTMKPKRIAIPESNFIEGSTSSSSSSMGSKGDNHRLKNDKPEIQSKKLDFNINESMTEIKTVVKVPKAKISTLKPRGLNFDEDKPRKPKVSTTSATSKTKAKTGGSSIKIHVDTGSNEKKPPKRILSVPKVPKKPFMV